MFCKNCGKELNDNAAVCLNCGVLAGRGSNYCQHCGFKPDPLASVCVNCGQYLSADAKRNAERTRRKSTVIHVSTFGDALKSCFTKYVDFSGRASRCEFWYFYLFQVLVMFIPNLLYFIGIATWEYEFEVLGLVLQSIASAALFLPSLAVGARRLHDTGRSGWNMLFALIPLVGAILLIVWWCEDSEDGSNEYGNNPKSL